MTTTKQRTPYTKTASDDLSERVATAIDTIHSVRFIPGTKTRGAGPAEYEYLRALSAGRPEGAHLRVFQRHGLSSTVVAKALRKGILVAVKASS